MRRLAYALAFSILGSLSASAEVLVSDQDNLDDLSMLKLTFPVGGISISMNTVEGYGLFVHSDRGSHEVLLESDHMPRLLKTYNDSALLELNFDLSGCPIMFAWVTYDEAGMRSSKEFGTCAEEASLEDSAAGPVITMDDPNNPGTTVNYVYDETTGKLAQR